MTPRARQLMQKILEVGPEQYFSKVGPLWERSEQLCAEILQTSDRRKVEELMVELMAIGNLIDAAAETRQ